MDWLLLLKWFLSFDIVCFDQCHIILNFFTAISPLWLKCLKSISLQPFRKQDGRALPCQILTRKLSQLSVWFTYVIQPWNIKSIPSTNKTVDVCANMFSCNQDKRVDAILLLFIILPSTYYTILQINISNQFMVINN